MNKILREKVELKLFQYPILQARAVELGIHRYEERFTFGYSNTKVKTSNDNKTEAALIKAIDSADQLSKWCKVFENTYDRYRFEAKGNFMVAYFIERQSITKTCRSAAISESTFYNWRKEIIDIACKWAQELGLIPTT